MADFNRSQIFNGTCAPLLYIADCAPTARTAYMNASRFWLAANAIALIALVVSLIRRSMVVRERFNTLRLTVICFAVGGALHVIYDALRVGDPKQHGVPPHIMAFLWACGWVAYNIGNQLLIVTWVSFSSKDLMARPALTGHPTLFWSTTIPFTVVNIVASLLCGVNYWYYWVSMRVAIAAWAAFALVTALFAGYYGNQMLVRLNKSRDSFNWKQQFRVLVCLVFMLVSCGICLGIQSYFLTRIDEIYQVFIAVTSLYRLCGLFILVGSAAYVWYSTTHYVSHSTRGSNSDKSAYKSTAPRNGYISSTGGSMEDRTAAATAALNNDSSTTTSSNMEEDNYEDDPKEDDGEEYEAEEDGGIIEENSSSTEDSESESSSSRGDENV